MRHIQVTFKIHVADDSEIENRNKAGFIKTLIDHIQDITLGAFDETIHDVEIKDTNTGEVLLGYDGKDFINKFE